MSNTKRAYGAKRQQQHLDAAEEGSNNVRVVLRIRPMLPSETERSETENARVLPDEQSVLITAQHSQNRKVESQQHRLDRVLGPHTTQLDFFHQSGVESYCDSALEGMAATVFCFGQTGGGKTYTMSGPVLERETLDDHAGLQFRAAHYMARAADELNRAHGTPSGFTPIILRASFLEIYNEAINDLLNDTTNLKMRWSQAAQTFFIEGLMIVQCDDVSDLQAVMTEGNNNRKRSTHKLNVDSSRSHVIFTIYVERRDAPNAPPKLGKIHFVDLAGSEKLKDSESSGIHCDETKSINKSLFALGNVIACLSKGGGAKGSATDTFVPYRDSTLTKLLMDSLGGHARTLMVACITPSNRFTEESLRTIAYAMRTKNIVNANPIVRVDPKQQELHELRIELQMLRNENRLLKSQLAATSPQHQQAGLQRPHDPLMVPMPTPPPAVGTSHTIGASPLAMRGAMAAPQFAGGNKQSGQSRSVAPSPSASSEACFSPTLAPSNAFMPSMGSFGFAPYRLGAAALGPPGTAQSSASAPAALYGAQGGSHGGMMSPIPLLPAQPTSSSNWTTSSVRSLPALPHAAQASLQIPSLSSEQYAAQMLTSKVQHDNEELRKELAALRTMVLTMKNENEENAVATKKPPGQPSPAKLPAPSLGASPHPDNVEPHATMPAVDEAGRSGLTEFGFRPAPKKLQKLTFPAA